MHLVPIERPVLIYIVYMRLLELVTDAPSTVARLGHGAQHAPEDGHTLVTLHLFRKVVDNLLRRRTASAVRQRLARRHKVGNARKQIGLFCPARTGAAD